MDKLAFTQGNNVATDFFSYCILAYEVLIGKFVPKITDVDSLLNRDTPSFPDTVPEELRRCLLSGFDDFLIADKNELTYQNLQESCTTPIF